MRSLEIEIERHWTGNLFLETWSNRILDGRDACYEHGSMPGWLVTSRADLLMVYFLDSDDLVTVPLQCGKERHRSARSAPNTAHLCFSPAGSAKAEDEKATSRIAQPQSILQ